MKDVEKSKEPEYEDTTCLLYKVGDLGKFFIKSLFFSQNRDIVPKLLIWLGAYHDYELQFSSILNAFSIFFLMNVY